MRGGKRRKAKAGGEKKVKSKSGFSGGLEKQISLTAANFVFHQNLNFEAELPYIIPIQFFTPTQRSLMSLEFFHGGCALIDIAKNAN